MKNFVWAAGAFIVIIALFFLFTSNNRGDDTIVPTPKPFSSSSAKLMNDEPASPLKDQPFAILPGKEIEGKKVSINTQKGEIELELYGDSPLAASNFIDLINKNFYDGLAFHRREEGFVIQGGDPNGNGSGGPGYSFADEPVTREYTRGIVAMANAGPDTNGSQFFIMLDDAPQLPKQYTIFGKVTKGLDVVDKIAVGDKMIELTLE